MEGSDKDDDMSERVEALRESLNPPEYVSSESLDLLEAALIDAKADCPSQPEFIVKTEKGFSIEEFISKVRAMYINDVPSEEPPLREPLPRPKGKKVRLV